DRPRLESLGEIEPFPAFAAVRAPVWPIVRRHVDDVGVGRIHGDGVHMDVVGQALDELLPRPAGCGPAEESAASPGGPVRSAYVHVRGGGRLGHGVPLPGVTLPQPAWLRSTPV